MSEDVDRDSAASLGSGFRMYRAVLEGRGDGPDEVFLFESYDKAAAMLGDRLGVVQEVVVVPSPWIDGVIGAWASMKMFGAHDGECDNDETCEKCGCRLRGCATHMEITHRRMVEMDEQVSRLSDRVKAAR